MLKGLSSGLLLAALAGCASNPNADSRLATPGNPALNDPQRLTLQQKALKRTQDEEDPAQPVDALQQNLDRAQRTIEGLNRLFRPR